MTNGLLYMSGLLDDERTDFATCVRCGRRLDVPRFGPTAADCGCMEEPDARQHPADAEDA